MWAIVISPVLREPLNTPQRGPAADDHRTGSVAGATEPAPHEATSQINDLSPPPGYVIVPPHPPRCLHLAHRRPGAACSVDGRRVGTLTRDCPSKAGERRAGDLLRLVPANSLAGSLNDGGERFRSRSLAPGIDSLPGLAQSKCWLGPVRDPAASRSGRGILAVISIGVLTPVDFATPLIVNQLQYRQMKQRNIACRSASPSAP